MQLVEIDILPPQAAQTVIDFSQNLWPPRVRNAVTVLPGQAAFGGEIEILSSAMFRQGLAHDLLGMALPINKGGIDEIDTVVENSPASVDGFALIHLAPFLAADRPRCQARCAKRARHGSACIPSLLQSGGFHPQSSTSASGQSYPTGVPFLERDRHNLWEGNRKLRQFVACEEVANFEGGGFFPI